MINFVEEKNGSLKAKSVKNISNPVSIHYVLQGASATIQNVSLM